MHRSGGIGVIVIDEELFTPLIELDIDRAGACRTGVVRIVTGKGTDVTKATQWSGIVEIITIDGYPTATTGSATAANSGAVMSPAVGADDAAACQTRSPDQYAPTGAVSAGGAGTQAAVGTNGAINDQSG